MHTLWVYELYEPKGVAHKHSKGATNGSIVFEIYRLYIYLASYFRLWLQYSLVLLFTIYKSLYDSLDDKNLIKIKDEIKQCGNGYVYLATMRACVYLWCGILNPL